jgi:hypothetical protein
VGLRFSKCTGGSVDFFFGGPSKSGHRILPTHECKRGAGVHQGEHVWFEGGIPLAHIDHARSS